MLTHTKTGNVRVRLDKRLFRKPLLVLQCEWHITGYQVHDSCGSGMSYDYTEWRDAAVHDLTMPGSMAISE
jgi:hypothetical protein